MLLEKTQITVEDFFYASCCSCIPFYFVENGEIKGHILLDLDELAEEGIISLWEVEIYEKCRRQGFAKKMIKETIDYISRTFEYPYVEKVTLLVEKNNEIALNLYKKFGFKIVGTEDGEWKMARKNMPSYEREE
jgi:diamine N-acetyltransferase